MWQLDWVALPGTLYSERPAPTRPEPFAVGGTVESTGFWIIVGSQGNFERTRELGFSIQGMKSRHRKKAERMRPGDKIAYYVTGRKVFAATATITSPYVEDHERIWQSGDPKKAAEDYPFRVGIGPDVLVADVDAVDAEPIARQMAYVARYPPTSWTLAFQGNVHAISAADFQLIRDALAARVPVEAANG